MFCAPNIESLMVPPPPSPVSKFLRGACFCWASNSVSALPRSYVTENITLVTSYSVCSHHTGHIVMVTLHWYITLGLLASHWSHHTGHIALVTLHWSHYTGHIALFSSHWWHYTSHIIMVTPRVSQRTSHITLATSHSVCSHHTGHTTLVTS